MKYKDILYTITGALGGCIASAFGGWNNGIKVLLILMLLDMVTGIISALISKSPKTATGALNSYVTWKGIAKKITTLLMVVMAYQLDVVLHTNVIRDAAVIAFIFNEGTSILENAGNIGVPMPAIIKKALDVLKEKSDSDMI